MWRFYLVSLRRSGDSKFSDLWFLLVVFSLPVLWDGPVSFLPEKLIIVKLVLTFKKEFLTTEIEIQISIEERAFFNFLS